MADEPRRSGRATKGQHKNASSSPAPNPKSATSASAGASTVAPNIKAPRGKLAKKKLEATNDGEEEEDDDEEIIRCICGNTNAKDKRAFIGCDACTAWQHNVCMGIPDDEDDVPEHYFCEECRPEEHQETIQAIEQGEKIWESRNRIWQNEKKMSKSRKSRAKSGEDYRPGWLKKEVLEPESTIDPAAHLNEDAQDEDSAEPDSQPEAKAEPAPESTSPPPEAGNKRKREESKEEPVEDNTAELDDKPARSSRQDKRRKSSTAPMKDKPDADIDPDTALVDIDQLPQQRQKVARALAGIVTTDIEERVKSGLRLQKGQTPNSLGDEIGLRIEYGLHMNHGVAQSEYSAQFRALRANMKKNKVLIQRLLNKSLAPDELSTMSSNDMASEELQRERAELKEVLDRQAVAVQEEGPRYAQDHKGYHLIETEAPASSEPVQESQKLKGDGVAVQSRPLQEPSVQSAARSMSVDTSKQVEDDRRSSSQQFDMNNIWAKTAQSPTNAAPPAFGGRPMHAPIRRRSSVHRPALAQQNGAKDDPDIDRMLQDNDDGPAEASTDDAIVWSGKLLQSSEDTAATVNARFVAGRDLTATLSWHTLLPKMLSIDGRLQVRKAEEYLCGLRWSTTSDVTVLSLTPHDNAEAFNSVFNYFATRTRYAVVEKDKPSMVKDLYIVPVEVGAALPDHIEMLEHCTIKKPVSERLLLATLIVARAPESPAKSGSPAQYANGNLPQHVRHSVGGPAGSPLTSQHPSFSPSNSVPPQQTAYAAPNAFPPNPYGPAPTQLHPGAYSQNAQAHPSQQVNEVLGDLQYTPTAQQILQASMQTSEALSIDQLLNLKAILESDPQARSDFEVLTKRLYARG